MGNVPNVSYEPIQVWSLVGLGFPRMERHTEAATQTWQVGVPLKIDGSGNVVECAFSGADIVYGVSAEHSHNLVTAATAQDLSEATPPNQSGVTTPIGAWIRDGNCGLYQANGITTFSAALKTGQVFTQALIIPGTFYRLIKDTASGFWYVDNTLTGGNAGVVNLQGVDPSCPNTVAGGCRVFFQFADDQRAFK